MFGPRDIFWAAVICLALNLGLYYRPLWSARSFIEDEAWDGFATAYDGHRFINGKLIKAPNKTGSRSDPLEVAVMRRSLMIRAEHLSWSGDEAEFVVRHAITLDSTVDPDQTQDIHVKLERRHGRWEYQGFQVRDRAPLLEPNSANPFARALRRGEG